MEQSSYHTLALIGGSEFWWVFGECWFKIEHGMEFVSDSSTNRWKWGFLWVFGECWFDADRALVNSSDVTDNSGIVRSWKGFRYTGKWHLHQFRVTNVWIVVTECSLHLSYCHVFFAINCLHVMTLVFLSLPIHGIQLIMIVVLIILLLSYFTGNLWCPKNWTGGWTDFVD